MKLKLIYVGKTGASFLKEGELEYLNRVKRFIPFEIIEIPDVKNAKSRSFEEIKNLEGEAILEKINPNEYVILLDEKGKEYTSTGFANFLQKKFNSSQDITFVIGGPYGFSSKVYDRSNTKLALSKLTFSHQMVRIFFLEQLYRALSILNNMPYHHD